MLDSVRNTITSLPKARTSDIVVQDLGNEILVYDLLTNKAHQLNETMSLVWKNCDGVSSKNEVIAILEDQTSSKIDSDLIDLALAELHKSNLLSDQTDIDVPVKISRRDIAFKYAPMAVALPIVVSLVAPAAVQAQSCLAPSTNTNTDPQCSGPSDCCNNFCFDLGAPWMFCV